MLHHTRENHQHHHHRERELLCVKENQGALLALLSLLSRLLPVVILARQGVGWGQTDLIRAATCLRLWPRALLKKGGVGDWKEEGKRDESYCEGAGGREAKRKEKKRKEKGRSTVEGRKVSEKEREMRWLSTRG